MADKDITNESFIVCKNSQGSPVRGVCLRMTRYVVSFEVYNPFSILQISEVLTDFQIFIRNRVSYSGRAVVSAMVNTGTVLVCEATLEEDWLDIDLLETGAGPLQIKNEYLDFFQEWEKVQIVSPEFKLLVADMHTFLTDLHRWMEQVEFSLRQRDKQQSQNREVEVIHELSDLIVPTVQELFDKFESVAGAVEKEIEPAHRVYVRRLLHPLVLCSPFLWRTYTKPLGYAGDYEMVNMLLRDPVEGPSLFAKLLNLNFLALPAGQAHRNRVTMLADYLNQETRRMMKLHRPVRMFNLGCGPAQEVQRFLSQDDLCERADLTLLDFNEETIGATTEILQELKARYARKTTIRTMQRSVHQILKDKSGTKVDEKFDFVYCAGLFDYLSDRVAKRLTEILYEMVAPGGLLVVTNVETSNPSIKIMEYMMEWHLIYRDSRGLMKLRPDDVKEENCRVIADNTGFNIFLEVRRP